VGGRKRREGFDTVVVPEGERLAAMDAEIARLEERVAVHAEQKEQSRQRARAKGAEIRRQLKGL